MTKTIAILILLLLPVTVRGAEVIKFRQITSVYTDAAGAGVVEPEGIGCGNGTAFLISDTKHSRLQSFTLSDGILKPGQEIKAPQIAYPQRVRLNSKGEIYVLEGKQHRILHLDSAGAFKNYVEAQGLPGPATSWIPRSIAVDANDNLYILDVSSARVLVLSPEEKFQKQISYPQNDGFFSDVTVDPLGTIYVLNSISGSIYSATRDADTFTPFVKGLHEFVNFPTSIAVDKQRIYIVDQNGGGVAVLGKDGAFQGHKLRMGWKEGELRYPSDICLDSKGYIFIADRGNNRVQIFVREEENK